jgi:hypothetical protein
MILIPIVTVNKNGKYRITIQKNTALAAKHAKLFSKCRPPEKVLIDNKILKQNKNS